MIHKTYTFRLTILLVCIELLLPNTTRAIDVPELLQRGQEAYEQGAFAQATQYWEVALTETSYSLQYINLLIDIATAYQAINQPLKAYQWLQKAAQLAEKQETLAQQALIYSHLGKVLLTMRKPKEAETYLHKGIILLRLAHEPYTLAHLQDNFGCLAFSRKDYNTALTYYQQAIELAKIHGDSVLLTQNLTHLGWTYFKKGYKQAAELALQKALVQVQQQPPSYIKAKQWVGLGYLGLQIQPTFAIHEVLEEALALVTQYQDSTLHAVTLGYLGQAYEQVQRLDKAMTLTEQAIQYSQGREDLLYRWAWQQGRLLQKQGNLTDAIASYQRALTYKQALHYPFIADHIDTTDIFRHYIYPVYRSLLDVLLQQATMHINQKKMTLLKEARDTFEQLMIATITDHFREMPINNRQSLVDPISYLKEGNAVLYLLSLPDRVELLLVSPAGFFHETTRVPEEQLRQTVEYFQQQVQETTQMQFVEPATQLYQWLIAPLRSQLVRQQIDTLIIVPEGILLTVPFAALLDKSSQQFLIEQVALAVTSSLDLTIPGSPLTQNSKVLLTGLAETMTGYTELKTSLREVTEINALLNTDMLLDARFTLDNIQEMLQDTSWSVLHIASHCRIFPEPTETFLLTYNGRVGLNQLADLLGSAHKHSLNLLTLSYCQTVTNDKQTLLGLTSLVFKVGVSSALVNLWFVDHDSTAKLMKAFYAYLQQTNVSKAQALQRAQLELLKQSPFQHPYYWATFRLTGHWF